VSCQSNEQITLPHSVTNHPSTYSTSQTVSPFFYPHSQRQLIICPWIHIKNKRNQFWHARHVVMCCCVRYPWCSCATSAGSAGGSNKIERRSAKKRRRVDIQRLKVPQTPSDSKRHRPVYAELGDAHRKILGGLIYDVQAQEFEPQKESRHLVAFNRQSLYFTQELVDCANSVETSGVATFIGTGNRLAAIIIVSFCSHPIM